MSADEQPVRVPGRGLRYPKVRRNRRDRRDARGRSYLERVRQIYRRETGKPFYVATAQEEPA